MTEYTRRGEYKAPGEKLVAVQAMYDDDKLRSVALDGDFFIDGIDDPQRIVSMLEDELVGVSAHKALEDVRTAYPQAHIVGLTAQAIEEALRRAGFARQYLEHREPENHGAHAHMPTSSDGRVTQLDPAWDNYAFEFLTSDTAYAPAMHMALDDVIAHQVASGERGATLRFWQWASSAVVIGLHQSVGNEVDVQVAHGHDMSIVRRMTGGGAMFIEPGNTITYSLYVPSDFVGELSGYEAYKRCDEWALLALRSIGIDAHYKPINDITSPMGKIGGAAQRRYAGIDGGPGCVLHHVTMAYDIDAQKMINTLRISREKISDKPIASAVKRVDPLKSQTQLDRQAVIDAMTEFALSSIPHISQKSLDEDTLTLAHKLVHDVYGSDEWTYRIA